MNRLPFPFLLALLAACAGAPSVEEASVKPGINANFTDPNLDVDRFVERFETESREVFANRSKIARAVGLRKGMAVADVGAGTGIFVDFFARDVGADGRVYAVEIVPKFVDRLKQRAIARRQPQVEAVLCTERDVSLPPESVDVIFTCDTYHHFEYPRSTVSSIHRALRPGGKLVVVDFERIPGVSREWILGHVRCGKEVVIEEVTAAGFELSEELPIAGLRENYFISFTKV